MHRRKAISVGKDGPKVRSGRRLPIRLHRPLCIFRFPPIVSFPTGSGFWLPAFQIVASFNLVVSVVMSANLIKMEKGQWWRSCYIWTVWVEGPLGFGLLLSCRIVQAFQLYFIFVKKRLPPLRSCFCLPLILLPWILGAGVVHVRQPLNHHCQMSAWWITPIVCLHALYIAILMCSAWAIWHVEFRFQELKDLRRGILVSTSSVGIWVAAYILNQVHEDVHWIQVVARFMLMIMTSIFIVAFFSMSSSQPLISKASLRRREHRLKLETMGEALGIHDSGILLKKELANVDPNEPLDKLLLDKRFRLSFMAFADSCLAGESVHFYDEVHELRKLHAADETRRIYMARHIIEKYIVAGAVMEVNISFRSRQEILNTHNLAHPNLFKNATDELLQLMKMNLVRDYLSSELYMRFRDEASVRRNSYDLEMVTGAWNVSPRLSSVCASDDPFLQDQQPFRCVVEDSNILDLGSR